jgi:hypothetical protein
MRWIWIGLVSLGLAWAQETPQDTVGWWGQETPQDTLGWRGGQEAPSPAPTPLRRIRWKISFYQAYLEVGYNHFMGLPADLATSVQGLGSVKFNFQFMKVVRIGNSYYGNGREIVPRWAYLEVGVGPGIVTREVRFEKNAVLYRDTTGFLTYTFDTLITIQGYSAKSKFQLGYLRIPLELGTLYKGFDLAVFGYVDILAWVRQKRKYSTNDESIKQIRAGNKNFGTQRLQYGVGGRVGIDWIGAFFNFNLSPLWRSTKGPDNVRPIQVGIYIYRDFYKKSQSRRIYL